MGIPMKWLKLPKGFVVFGRPRVRPERFDALKLIRRVEKAGFKVNCLDIIGPGEPGDQPIFVIDFNPVQPTGRIPVERIISKMGLQVEGGGTGLLRDGKVMKMVSSDVSFQFKRTFLKKPADTAIDVIRHLERELNELRVTVGGRKPRPRRRRRTAKGGA
jgi:hypothetical protein